MRNVTCAFGLGLLLVAGSASPAFAQTATATSGQPYPTCTREPKPDEVEGARQLPSTRALTAWCYETARKPFHIAAAGLLVGLESQVPGIYKRNLPPLTTHYGFTDHEVEFFAIHIEADEVHGERGYQIVERHSTNPEKQAEAVEAVREATEMRWQYMTGLHRAFVLKEDA